MATRFIILMGVCGCGKTTIGRDLAARLGWSFHDADDFHPPENIARMASGQPLTDEHRAGWLAALAAMIRAELDAGRSGVLACSALKQRYRDTLTVDAARVRFIHLSGSRALIAARMAARTDHFMKPGMLESQFATLEVPTDALTFDIARAPDEIVQSILKAMALPEAPTDGGSAAHDQGDLP